MTDTINDLLGGADPGNGQVEPTDDQIRAWAVEHGYKVGERGRVNKAAREAYEREHGLGAAGDDERDLYAAAAGTYGEGDGDYITAGEPPGGPEPGADEWAGDDTAQDERRPTRGRKGRGRGGLRAAFTRPRMPAAAKLARPRRERQPRARPQHKWVSVRNLIEEAYGELGWAAKPIPPLSRMFYAQAPIAGIVLEPAVKGTLPDRLVLQPLARNYEKYKAVTGLVGPPVALMAVMATAPRPLTHEDGSLVLRPVITPEGDPVTDPLSGEPLVQRVTPPPSFEYKSAMVMLRYSIGVMVDAAGGANMQKIVERARERDDREDRINDFLAFILGMPAPPEDDMTRGTAEGQAAAMRLVGADADEQ